MQADAIFFDAGNTLIYADPPVGEVYARALRGAGAEVSGEEMEARFRDAFSRLAGRRSGGRPPQDKAWWRRVVRECFRSYGPLDSFEEVFEGLWQHFARGAAWRVYDDVLPAFEALRARGKRLGLISNWDARLDGVLAELDLAGRLDCAVISHHAGAQKPDPAIFRRAAALCGLKPGRAVHVGDSYEDDVLGAQAAGMQALWLRRGDTASAPPSPDAARVHVLTGLGELPGLIE